MVRSPVKRGKVVTPEVRGPPKVRDFISRYGSLGGRALLVCGARESESRSGTGGNPQSPTKGSQNVLSPRVKSPTLSVPPGRPRGNVGPRFRGSRLGRGVVPEGVPP